MGHHIICALRTNVLCFHCRDFQNCLNSFRANIFYSLVVIVNRITLVIFFWKICYWIINRKAADFSITFFSVTLLSWLSFQEVWGAAFGFFSTYDHVIGKLTSWMPPLQVGKLGLLSSFFLMAPAWASRDILTDRGEWEWAPGTFALLPIIETFFRCSMSQLLTLHTEPSLHSWLDSHLKLLHYSF